MRQLQVASIVEFFENFMSKNIVKSYGDYPLLSLNQDFLDNFWFFDTFFQMKVDDDHIMYTQCY